MKKKKKSGKIWNEIFYIESIVGKLKEIEFFLFFFFELFTNDYFFYGIYVYDFFFITKDHAKCQKLRCEFTKLFFLTIKDSLLLKKNC